MQFLEYTPPELLGVLHYWMQDEEAKVKSDYERTRISTFFIITTLANTKSDFTYEKFTKHWKFPWETSIESAITVKEGLTPTQWLEFIERQKQAKVQKRQLTPDEAKKYLDLDE